VAPKITILSFDDAWKTNCVNAKEKVVVTWGHVYDSVYDSVYDFMHDLNESQKGIQFFILHTLQWSIYTFQQK
jgi:hypothetical protein